MAKIRLPDKCSNCGKKHSKKFWDFSDNTVLCDECNKKIGDKWQREIDWPKRIKVLKKFGKISGIVLSLLILLFVLYYYGLNGYGFNGYNRYGYDKEGFNAEGYDRQGYDKDGFNRQGFDRKGYDPEGYNSWGYDVNGFNRQGYDSEGYDNEGYNILGYNRQGYSKNPDNNEKVRKIAEEYYISHTYSLPDFFVCSDMAMDVWNLIKTQGINAKICAGNVNRDIFTGETTEYAMANTDHAWVLAETSPMAYVAVETTGGYLVHGENGLYYRGFCFENPAEFKKFLTLRDSYFQVCGEAEQMLNYWNENIAGAPYTYAVSEYQGRMNAKTQECNNIISELSGLIT